MRRSSRLAKKTRVNYGEDALWDRAVKKAAKENPDADISKLLAKKPLFRHKLPPAMKVLPKPPKTSTEWEKDTAVDTWGGKLDSAQQRVDKVLNHKGTKKNFEPTLQMGKRRRQLLYVNPGDLAIQSAISGYAKWTQPFLDFLVIKAGRLYWREDGKMLPFAMKHQKRHAVKRLYFDPREPSTIVPITQKLYKKFANINKRNVTNILRTLETYQLNFGRRVPPKIPGKVNYKSPGVIAIDMFFPSNLLGWEKANCLTCMDLWSRYCGIYVLDRKTKTHVTIALRDFLKRFASFGFLPRRIICDKGTDLAGAKEVMEKYRTKKDGKQPLVLHSATGTPVMVVEAMNAQIQRRMQVFRTSGLIENASQICHEIAKQINNEPRQVRANLTPIQLLSLNPAGREKVNSLYKNRRQDFIEIPGLKPVFVGDHVRLLQMTRKEQVMNKTKGFAPKWSRRIYTVKLKRRLRKNQDVFRYDLGLPNTYYRHEILKIPKKLDAHVPADYVRYKEVLVED